MNFFDDAAASTPLLMQCGYRSKVCTNPRATKLDGTPHKLCEFHRRKANLNQQRLHKRQREKRAAQELRESVEKDLEAAEDHSAKRAHLSVEPIVHWSTDDTCYYGLGGYEHPTQQTSSVGETLLPRMGSQDMDILELLLMDMQSLPPLASAPPASVDYENFVDV
ncbi:hypothetical protein PHYSODRAFT_286731 [Phytophthora sojae]|uniref:Uncharacterized protein n=1 Tax=Phytophthora sojae (strain P6497) TaxID=1094619 RepID=G4ZSI4_PHYSP|nr:hypothetical protein PHYSODRAFT_286731 [Phytophthora sojae]EGZ14064.1 hypothetical protein PHYSODRAFT_286731 [Phytophthora sojae]|eukprot:XP_009531493.1 hypothetical protein PHYSODRAFT_286731 [Phytophthora sojae]